MHPILEYQSDPHSFAFRPHRSPVDAIALVIKYLSCLQKKNTRFITPLQLKTLKKTRGELKNPKLDLFNQFFVNVNVHKCFDKANHAILLKTYPLCNKYRYLLRA